MVLEGLHEEAMQRFLDEVNMEKETGDYIFTIIFISCFVVVMMMMVITSLLWDEGKMWNKHPL